MDRYTTQSRPLENSRSLEAKHLIRFENGTTGTVNRVIRGKRFRFVVPGQIASLTTEHETWDSAVKHIARRAHLLA